jgi:hypothetical protein
MSYNSSPRRGAVMGSLRLRHALPAVAAAFVAVLFGSSAAFASTGHTGFGFNAPNISGGSGSVFLTGGGAFDSTSGFAHSAGGFKCTSTVTTGPLAGCLAGQGVRWDTAALLQSTPSSAPPPIPRESRPRPPPTTPLCCGPTFTEPATGTTSHSPPTCSCRPKTSLPMSPASRMSGCRASAVGRPWPTSATEIPHASVLGPLQCHRSSLPLCDITWRGQAHTARSEGFEPPTF